MFRSSVSFERLGRAFIGNFAGHILQTVALLASAALLARLLGPAGLGTVVIVTATVKLAVVPAQEGAARLCERELSGAIGKEDGGQARASLRLNAVGSAAIALIGAVAVWLLLAGNEVTSTWCLLLVGVVLCSADTAISSLRGVLRGEGQTVASVRLTNLITLTAPVLYLVYWRTTGELTVIATLWLQVVSKLIWLPWALSRAQRVWTAVVPAMPYGSKLMPIPRRWVAESLQFALLGVVSVALGQIGIVMLGYLGTAEEAGIFRIASRAFLIAGLVTTAALQAFGPHISRAWQAGDREMLESPSRMISVLAFGFSLFALLGFVLIGRFLIVLVFGEDFEPAYWPSVCLIVAAAITSFTAASGRLLKMTGEQRIVFWGTAAALTVAVALNFVLIPPLGAMGCALSFLLATLVARLVLMCGVHWHIGFWPLPDMNSATTVLKKIRNSQTH